MANLLTPSPTVTKIVLVFIIAVGSQRSACLQLNRYRFEYVEQTVADSRQEAVLQLWNKRRARYEVSRNISN